MFRITSVAAAAAAILSAPVAAQDDVMRRSFAFFDRNVTVEVVGEGSGVLHVVRGGRDRIEVTARSETASPAFAMTGSPRHRLRLSGAGEGHEYVVVVPEDVRLEILLPEDSGARSSFGGATETYRWPAAAPAGEAYVPTGGTRAMFAYDYVTSPAVLSLPAGAALGRLTVGVGEHGFRIAASQPLGMTHAGARTLEVAAQAGTPDVVLELPAGLDEFVLLSGGRAVLEVRQGVVRVYCSPATKQVLEGGRQRIDLSPSDPRWGCGAGV